MLLGVLTLVPLWAVFPLQQSIFDRLCILIQQVRCSWVDSIRSTPRWSWDWYRVLCVWEVPVGHAMVAEVCCWYVSLSYRYLKFLEVRIELDANVSEFLISHMRGITHLNTELSGYLMPTSLNSWSVIWRALRIWMLSCLGTIPMKMTGMCGGMSVANTLVSFESV